MICPPRLREGARVALVAPAGPVGGERVALALERCTRLGLEPVLAQHAQNTHAGYLAGSDEERLADLRWAFSARDIDAVWALRGGYGIMRLLAPLDLEPLLRSPRAFIGFSDNTALLLALHRRGIVSYHAPHAGSAASPLAEECLQRVLWNAAPAGMLPLSSTAPVALRPGIVEAPLVGGNLALLAALCGTPAAPRATRRLLFIEDIGEPLYRIDRMWMQLLLSGVLDDVAGIIFGHFTDCGEREPLLELLHRLSAPLGVPTVAGMPIGHEADNWTLPLGVRARLDAGAGTLELVEAAVSA
jgi:muramoyltetrapeptide carboxypeptidase